jgi:transposase
MSDRKNKTYTEEFKAEALALLKNSDKNARQIEQELGITAGMLTKWRDKYQVVIQEPGGVSSLEPSDLEAAKREIKRLQRELTEVAEEREILKKVVNIFSRKSG